MRIRRFRALALAGAFSAAACGTGEAGTPASSPRLVAGFYPLAEAAARVGGDRIEVTNLTPSGTEPHDLELATNDVDRIEDADVVVYLGRGFQPAVEKAAKRARGVALDVLGDKPVDDPHIWLDPLKMAIIVGQVRDALVGIDADGAAVYRTNAESYLEELRALDEEFAAGLGQCQGTVIVTAHEAFGHLARRYGFEQEAIAGIGADSEPDPRRLSELAADVKAKGVTTIFTETIVSPKLAQTLAREAGLTTAVLDPLEGLSDERLLAGDDYASVMRENLGALRTALGCQ